MQPVESSTRHWIRVLLLAVVLGVMAWMLWPSRPAHLPPERRPDGTAARDSGAAAGDASGGGKTEASEVAEKTAGETPAAAALLTGRVVRGDDESPVAGALVRLSPQPRAAADPFETGAEVPVPDAGGFARREVHTGADGHFSFDGIPRRAPLLLEVDEPASGLVAFIVSVHEDAESPCELGDIRIWPAMTLEVLVRDEEDAPVEHAVVDVSPGGSDMPFFAFQAPRRQLEHRDGGLYVLDRVPEAEDTVNVAARGFGSTTETYYPPLEGPVRVQLVAANTVEGRVLTVAGDPIPGAAVRSGEDNDRPENSTTTDEEGRFRFDHLDRNNDYALQATAAGYCIGSSNVAVGVERVDIRLFREARVAGQVVSAASGTPLREARIDFQEAGEEIWQEYGVTVDAGGRFKLGKLLPGRYELEADEGEHLPAGTTLELAEGEARTDLVFQLQPGLRRAGKVVDAATGQPLSDVTVSFQHDVAAEGPAVSREATTDETGAFQASGLREGTCSLRVTRRHYLSSELSVDLSPEDTSPLELSLSPDPRPRGELTGRVLDPGEMPLAGIAVKLCFTERDCSGSITTGTDAEGRFRFHELQAFRHHSLQVDHEEFLPVRLEAIQALPGDTPQEVTIHLERGATVRGLVLDADRQPVAGALIRLSSTGSSSYRAKSHTQSDGTFEVRAITPGEHQLTASPDAGIPSSPRSFSVAGQEMIEGIELILPAGVQLRGRVLDTGSKPCPGATVELFTRDLSLTTTSDRRGAFAFTPVPAGRASLQVRDDRGGHAWLAVDVPADDVTVRLLPTFLLVGRLEAPGRTRLPRGSVGVERYLDGERVSWQGCTTDETGRFTLRTGPGKLLLAPDIPGFANVSYARSVLAEPSAELVLPLVSAGRVEGIVISAATGAPVSGCSIEVEPQDPRFHPTLGTRTESDGKFTLESLPAGTASVRAWSGENGMAIAEGVHIEADQTTTVRLQLATSSGVRGTATLDGEPVAGAQVTLRAPAGGFERSTRTRPSGGFELDGAPAGELELLVQVVGRQAPARRLVTVVADEITWLEVDLRLALLTGRVSRGGEPVTHATLYAVWASPGAAHADADTDARGEYLLEVPAGARIELTVVDAKGELRRLSVEMPSSDADLRRDIEVETSGR